MNILFDREIFIWSQRALFVSARRNSGATVCSCSSQAKAGLPLDAQITIPAITSLQQFAPHLALIGPGLSSSPSVSVPFSLPAGDGIQLLNAAHAGTSDQFDEPFTQTSYWNRQTLKEPLSVAGTYYLVVFNRSADTIQTGKYVLAVGDIEQFGPADLVTFPVTYFHVRLFTDAGLPLLLLSC